MVTLHEYFLHSASKVRDSKIRGVGEAEDNIVERGGHANEVYEPKDGPLRTMRSEINQLWEDEGNRGSWYSG